MYSLEEIDPEPQQRLIKMLILNENLFFSCLVRYRSVVVRLCTVYVQKCPIASLTYLSKINERFIKKLLFTNY